MAQIRPALRIETVSVVDRSLHLETVARINAVMRRDHDVPVFLRVYESIPCTGAPGATMVLSPAPTFEKWDDQRRLFLDATELTETRREEARAATAGPVQWLKAVRFDGTHAPGWLINTFVRAQAESALLDRVAAIAERLDADAGPRPLINVFRVVAGDGTATHLVSFNTDSSARLMQVLDALVATGWGVGPGPLTSSGDAIVSVALLTEVTP